MARSLTQAKLLAECIADGFSLFINRRGYAAALYALVSASLASGGGSRSRSRILRKIEERAYCGIRGFFRGFCAALGLTVEPFLTMFVALHLVELSKAMNDYLLLQFHLFT